ncbi:DUF4148 domain-containing protein [candidate division TA06 bacterium]|nr:DUF4148 domain-containing protein [candidate division TA06 bacterium]
MKKAIIILSLLVLCASSIALAVPAWCNGKAKLGIKYLNGWTIQVSNGTYGWAIAQPDSGYFGMSYSTHPPAGYFSFTADSSGQSRLFSNEYYYDGSSYGVQYGTVPFYTSPR